MHILGAHTRPRPEVGIAIAPGMRSLRPAAGVTGLIERISGRAGARARAQWALNRNAYKNVYSIFHIVQPMHKRKATASNEQFLLMQATGDSHPRQPAGSGRTIAPVVVF